MQVVAAGVLKAYIVNLEPRQVIYSAVGAGGALNCAQDTLSFGGNLIDLETASVIASPGNVAFTC